MSSGSGSSGAKPQFGHRIVEIESLKVDLTYALAP